MNEFDYKEEGGTTAEIILGDVTYQEVHLWGSQA